VPSIQPTLANAWVHRSLKWSINFVGYKARWGLLYTADKAAQYGKPDSGRPLNLELQGRALCPLCSNPDSNTHLMGGCEKTQYLKACTLNVMTLQSLQLHKPLQPALKGAHLYLLTLANMPICLSLVLE
jgi:hypothetical protein